MNWSRHIAVNPQGITNFAVEAKRDCQVKCIGASCATAGGQDFSNSFLCILRKDVKEVIAVIVRSFAKDRRYLDTSFMIGIDWKDGKPFVDPKHNWVSFDENTHGAISSDGKGVDVEINCKTFTSCENVFGTYPVDANILCEYLALKRSRDSLIKATGEVVAKTEHTATLEKKISTLTNRLERLEQTHSEVCDRYLLKCAIADTASEWQKAAKELSRSCATHWKAKKIFSTVPSQIQRCLDAIERLEEEQKSKNN